MCNVDLIGDLVSGAEDANFGFIAHIVADAPDGPREDAELSHFLADDPGNLRLLCHVHHKTIDVELVDEYPVERLLTIKADHERRVSIRTGVLPERASHVVRYAANVGQHRRTMPYEEVARAMLPDRHPANGRETIDLSLQGSVIEDDEQAYWHWRRPISDAKSRAALASASRSARSTTCRSSRSRHFDHARAAQRRTQAEGRPFDIQNQVAASVEPDQGRPP